MRRQDGTEEERSLEVIFCYFSFRYKSICMMQLFVWSSKSAFFFFFLLLLLLLSPSILICMHQHHFGWICLLDGSLSFSSCLFMAQCLPPRSTFSSHNWSISIELNWFAFFLSLRFFVVVCSLFSWILLNSVELFALNCMYLCLYASSCIILVMFASSSSLSSSSSSLLSLLSLPACLLICIKLQQMQLFHFVF